MLGFAFHTPFGAKSKSKSKKARKAPKENWFFRLSVDELKELCKVVGEKVSGNKAELVARLVQNEDTGMYAHERRSGTVSMRTCEIVGAKDGISLDIIKEQCKQRHLSATGNKYDLVLRVLQDKKGVGAPKRVRTEVDPATGEQQPVKRAKSTKAPELRNLTNRVERKISIDKSKWSNYKWKQHCGIVADLCQDIIRKEAIEKGFTEQGNPLAMKICHAVVQPVIDVNSFGCAGITGWGYASWEMYQLGEEMKKVFAAVKGSLAPEDLDAARKLFMDLEGVLQSYGYSPFKDGLAFLNE